MLNYCITERKMDYATIEKLTGRKKAKPFARAVTRKLGYLVRKAQLFFITTDNDPEFIVFKAIEKRF